VKMKEAVITHAHAHAHTHKSRGNLWVYKSTI